MAQGKNRHPLEDGWMQGFPPPREKLVRFADSSFYSWPKIRWSFSHMEELVPTRSVWRGTGPVRGLDYDLQDFDKIQISTLAGEKLAWDELLERSCTDALIVLHRGVVRYESYYGHCGEHTRHILQSANKSIVGILVESLIAERVLSADDLVVSVIPELIGSAFETATVQQVLDMVISMDFQEDYLDPKSEIWDFHRATGMAPLDHVGEPPLLSEVLTRVKQDGEHGRVFAYREPNIFVLGWFLRRVSQKNISTLLSERIWQKLGAEHDGYYLLDPAGGESSSCFTLRDLARFGDLILNKGSANGQQLIPAAAIEKILSGGDQEIFAKAGYETLPGWSYKSQWWIRHIEERICLVARGAHGQLLYLDPTNEMVIARFASAKKAPSTLYDDLMLPLIDAITQRLA